MEVSFTGINNLFIGKKTYSKVGEFRANNGQIKTGEKNCVDILIKCDLSDDETGNHLSDFHSAVKKCCPEDRASFVNPENPNHIKFVVRRTEVEDKPSPVSFSVLKLNGGEVTVDNRQVLGLCTYLAKLTSDIVSLESTSKAQKKYAQIANNSIAEEAVYYIDYVM